MPEDMRPYIGADLAALFEYEYTVEAQYNSRTYTAIEGDNSFTEVDEFGGPSFIDLQEYHFKTTDLPNVEIGTEMTVAGKLKIIVSAVISADGNELIVRVRAA